MKPRLFDPVVATTAALVLVLAAVVSAGPAQAQDGEEAEIEARIVALVAAFNDGDADAFAAFFTDAGLIAFIDDPGVTTREEAIAILPELGLGESTLELVEVRDIEVTDGTATAIFHARFDGVFEFIDRITFTEMDGEWLINDYESGVEQPPPPEIPEGYETVPVDMDDYAFIFDVDQIDAGDLVAFEATNIGEEDHELVFFRIPVDLDLEEALASEDEPEGFEFLAFTQAVPGATGVAIVPDELTAGRYAMICFFETAEGVPHYELGMVADFILQEPATPTPTATTPATATSPASPTATATTQAPAPPATGTGTTGGTQLPLALLGFVTALAALTGAGALATKRITNR